VIAAFAYFRSYPAYLYSLTIGSLRSFAYKLNYFMETYDKGTKTAPTEAKQENNHGRLWSGLIVIAVGLLVLAEALNIEMPEWLFSWKTLLIGIGLYVGARQSFKPGGWMIAVAVGSVFIADEYMDELYLKPFLVPAIIIGIGLYIIFKPKKKDELTSIPTAFGNTHETGDLDSVSVFGSSKSVISKDFKGGEMVTIFGGSELNMMQADINGIVTVEVVQIFGGTKLVVPSHWRIKTSEVVSVFGGIDDKRPINSAFDDTKILNLKGVSIFGGIDIRSY
jgi:hypothetical protein